MTSKVNSTSQPPQQTQPAWNVSKISKITLMVLTILALSAAAAGVAYGLTHQFIPTLASGGGTLVVSGGLSIAIVLIYLRQSSNKKGVEKTPDLEQKVVPPSPPKPNSTNTTEENNAKEIKTDTEEPQKKSTDTPSSSLESKKEESNSKVTKVTADYISSLASNLTPISEASYKDPSSGADISLLEVYQRVLLAKVRHANVDVNERLKQLSSDQKLVSFVDGFITALFSSIAQVDYREVERSVRPYLRYLDPALLLLIHERVNSGNFSMCNHLLTFSQYIQSLKDAVDFFSQIQLSPSVSPPKDKKASHAASHILLERSVLQEHEFFGVALDRGFCFYHAFAQVLSVALKRPVTMQEIGEKMLSFVELKKSEFDEKYLKKQIGGVEKGHFATVEQYKEHLRSLAGGNITSDTWGDQQLDCPILAEIYSVQFQVIQTEFEKKKITVMIENDLDNDFTHDFEEHVVDDITKKPLVSSLMCPEKALKDCPLVKIALFHIHVVPLFQSNN